MNKGHKELAVLYIMDILASETYPGKPMLIQELEEYLRDEKGLDFDRRTVAAKVNLLLDDRRIVRKGRKSGVYFDSSDNEFSNEELELLIYSVMANRNLPPHQARSLANRLRDLGSPDFDPVIGFGRTMLTETRTGKSSGGMAFNQELLLNIDDINDAIRHRNKISFDYCRYGIDKKLHSHSNHTASPYYVMMKDQELWMVAYSETYETVSFFRVDRMKDLTILKKKAIDIKSVPGHGQGLDLEYLRSSLPYMYSDRPERIVFSADAEIIDQIVDWFGDAVKIEADREDSSKIKARLRTSPMAMEYWAKQYMDHVEILEPDSLRKRIKESLESGISKYADAEDGEGGSENV